MIAPLASSFSRLTRSTFELPGGRCYCGESFHV
jgi:hypothetical protein